MSPFLVSSSFQWWPHLPPSNLSSSSTSLTPTNFPSSFTASINMLFALHPCHLPAISNLNIFTVPPNNMSKLFSLAPSGFMSKISNMSCPSWRPHPWSCPSWSPPKEKLSIWTSVASCSASCLFLSSSLLSHPFSKPLLSFLLRLFGHICHISPPVCRSNQVCFVCQVWASCRWFSQMARQLEQLEIYLSRVFFSVQLSNVGFMVMHSHQISKMPESKLDYSRPWHFPGIYSGPFFWICH